ncbi:hypothetical protein OV203_48735 [Nannocystis sp. ILAH1]|uniref:hypothetical protein n=1 Tax=unclassified Nannocystis TaxID=2627009 RepID=UPI00226EB025|nr:MULTISPECIES: hypothetical protein [unclassified Nannocystis]MCY0995109.1 hypothetical protein [Nannocystis sp. ILAH1]MCY1069951.1 hypothetical protein [Nannocystis sp. RBIL2]
MHRPFIVLAVALISACGSTSDSTESSSTTGTTESTGTSTTTSTTTEEPSTTAATTSEGTAEPTSSTTTEAAPSCETSALECGVDVGQQMAFCPDMEDAVGSLVVDVIGPGHIRFTELGHDAACNLTFSPNVKLLANNTILVVYDIGGNPMDNCVCKYTISAELSNLTSGTWSIQVAGFSQQFDVP